MTHKDPSGGHSLSLNRRPFFSLPPPVPFFCYCVFEILNRREEREKTCDLCSTVFSYPKSWAWETTSPAQVDAIISKGRRRITNKTKKKMCVCVSIQQLMNNFRFFQGDGPSATLKLPGDNSGLNTKKELRKCFLINLGRWSSFVGSWKTFLTNKKKRQRIWEFIEKNICHYPRPLREKRSCDIVPNSLCYARERELYKNRALRLCGFLPRRPCWRRRMKIKLGEILCPWDSLLLTFLMAFLSLSQRRSFLFKCFLLKIIVIIILMKKKGENDPQLGLDVT